MNNNDGILKTNVDDKLSFIQQAYDNKQFDVVVKECCSLFEVVFKKIFSEAIANLPYQERVIIMEKEKEIGNSKKGVQEFGLGQLVGLFRESDLMQKWAKYSGKDLGLIDTLNFNSIVDLRNRLVHDAANCSRVEADLVYNYLKNLLANFGIINLEKAISTSFEKKEIKQTEESGKQNDNYAKIMLIKERGIIINEADGSRNISFKVDTINSMLESMYNFMVEKTDINEAKKALYNIGYEGGKKFGEAMNKKWELENMSYEEKITKWCEFDSVVGWGKFINNLKINTDEGIIEGKLSIYENFLCSNRRKKDIRLCDFLIGYSKAVLEELLDGLPIDVICDCELCPQDNPFKKECSFKLNLT
jgi:predicted hydrocarbon binding protein